MVTFQSTRIALRRHETPEQINIGIADLADVRFGHIGIEEEDDDLRINLMMLMETSPSKLLHDLMGL